MLNNNLTHIREKISSICAKLGRDPQGIILVCVTKEREPSQILEAIRSGITDIGENRVQEALSKFKEINSQVGVRWHMIGHLQRNKVRQALKIFDIIHSVDNLALAEEIDRESGKLNKEIDVLIQVNTSAEETKYGIKPDETLRLIEHISQLNNLRICGLMTMAPLTDNPEETRPCFRSLRILRDEVVKNFQDDTNIKMNYLSMGMSQDYEIALEEGANMLRIGRSIFSDV